MVRKFITKTDSNMKRIPLVLLAILFFSETNAKLTYSTPTVTTAPPVNTWTGTTSTDWSVSTNWSAGVPTAASDVDIPAAPSNQPVITNGTTALVNNLTIHTGASLTINTGGTLNVAPGGVVTNNGTFTTNGTFNSVALVIGDTYQGGKVAYILQPGDPGYIAGQTHGLIAAASDQSTGAQWGCFGTAIPGADGIALGTGNQNTIDIMAGCATAGIAARLCGDLVLNGFSDWYLPSKDELNKLYINRVAVGGFSSSYYWSSSETDLNNALSHNFGNGLQYNFSNKNSADYVRAVRAF
jgi:Protein of unknown function (DUF1566)